LDKFFDRLSNFFTRNIAPSSIFFILFFFNDLYFNNSTIYNNSILFFSKIHTINSIFLYIVLVIIFLSYGYVNQILSQLLDNFIKNDYSIIDKEFIKLRSEVKKNLIGKQKELTKIIDLNDYNIYQIIGKNIKTSLSYVDDVKSIHSLTLAINLNILIFYYQSSSLVEARWLCCIFFISVVFVIGNMIAKLRYKSRNKRMYINYLIKEDSTKTKIKYIKVNK